MAQTVSYGNQKSKASKAKWNICITYPWLSTNLGCALTLFPIEVSLDWIVQEESVLVEVVLGFLLRHAYGLGEGLPGWLSNCK